jgi:hypothetical protein
MAEQYLNQAAAEWAQPGSGDRNRAAWESGVGPDVVALAVNFLALQIGVTTSRM